MSEEKYKQIAPAVVLAQHGNKGAYRDLYIAYYKNIFFICNSMLRDVTAAIDLTCDIFVKMFQTVDKLQDHKAFEQWFYSLAINMCRQKMPEDSEKQTVLDEEVISLAREAAECAVKKDHFGFEHKIMKIIDGMVTSIPSSPRIILLYYYFAGIDTEKIAILEKITPEEADKDVKAIDAILNMQCEKLKNEGIDMSMFIENMGNSLAYTAQKSFVPDGVHSKISEKIGVDVNPFAPSPKEKEEMVEQAKNHIKEEEKKTEKKVKKNFFTKGDLILFFGVIAAVLIVFGLFNGYKQWKSDDDKINTPQTTQLQEKPALLWNGAAASSFDGGSGTKEDPFQIATGGQLAYLANLVNSGNSTYGGSYYILTADIILNETEDLENWNAKAPAHIWTPIGYYNSESDCSYFTGTFDGNGHTVTGLYINSDKDYSGLFGIIKNGTVKDLVIEESYVKGVNYTGGVAGCYISDSSEGNITNCGFSGTVNGTESYSGGITGAVKSQGEEASVRINSCYSEGTITAGQNFAGGISGICEAKTGEGRILNSFNKSKITASDFAGGLCGQLTADNGEGAFWYCYNAGEIVCSGKNSGGLAGRLEALGETGKTEVLFCYWLNNAASPAVFEENPKIVIENSSALSDAQMASPESFSEFDFSEIWIYEPEQNSENYKYPVFRYSVNF